MKFIKLSKVILNPAYIKKIDVNSKEQVVRISTSSSYYDLNGFFLAGSGFLFGGSEKQIISFSQEENPTDYDKILKWIDENSI